MTPPITILMASYNGARYLPAQLDSFLAQDWRNWRLLVSDDGSSDDTGQILAHYAQGPARGRIEVIDGPRRGATANFLHLLTQVDPEGPVAFSDQDDVWHPGKLSRAMDWLGRQNGPAVYAARTTICDQDLRPLNPAPHFPGPFGFRNALVQACLPGNTTVANPQALALLQAGAPAAIRRDVVAHDWWVYQLMSGAGATLYRDAAQVLLYRQHPRNVMGRNDTTAARAARFAMLFDGSFAGWLTRNEAALTEAAPLLTPENRALLAQFSRLLHLPGPAALRLAREMGLYRQTRAGTLAIRLAAMTGRLRARPAH
ncbi:glycosyltransferase [Paracoccus limosus]|uniref:Glycosyltransferase n=1 Tax=Paracoccus limosus TaxID=913252 RepID=A0A844H4S4_9RHOB|nr:glycosyltransferase [Paracoccus limosus]